MKLEGDDDLGTMIAIYCPPEIDNPSPVELFAKIAEPDPIQVIILASQRSGIDFDLNVCWEDQSGCGGLMPTPENPNTDGCLYNIPNSCTRLEIRLEIHPEVLATIKDGDEGSDNEDQSHRDPSDNFSDPDLDDIHKDIDDKGSVESENVNPHSTGNTGPGIFIKNNPKSFMTDVDLDVALSCEFLEYTNIVPAHLLDEEFDSEELFVG
ncbi:hypothetical protein Gotur_033302, partial [Gossypium turneri]